MIKSNAAVRAERIEGLLRFNRYAPAEEASMRRNLADLHTEVEIENLEAAWNKASKESRARFIDRVVLISWELK